MSKSNTFENDLMRLIFNNVAIATLGDAAGVQPSAAAGNLYLSLHTGDPDETGNQSTSETAYTGYARVPVVRSTSGFTVTANAVALAAAATFGTCTGAPGAAISHFGIGTSATGVGKLLYSGQLTSPTTLSVNITPTMTTAANLVTED
jgi:hypothetical protein